MWTAMSRYGTSQFTTDGYFCVLNTIQALSLVGEEWSAFCQNVSADRCKVAAKMTKPSACIGTQAGFAQLSLVAQCR